MTDFQTDSDGKLSSFAWPGGYPIYYMVADNAVLCSACANKENGSNASIHCASPDLCRGAHIYECKQWLIVAQDINWEDESLICEHCNGKIESAYGEDEETDE